MKTKTKVMAAVLASALMLAAVPAFAETAPGTASTDQVQSGQTAVQPGSALQKLQARAAKLGIENAQNMTKPELKAAIRQALKERRTDRLQKVASKLGINTAGMTNAQIAAAIKASEVEHLKSRAAKLGINTDNMTPAQIRQAIRQTEKNKWTARLDKIAAKYGVSTDGKTNKQIEEGILQARIAKLQQNLQKLQQSES